MAGYSRFWLQMLPLRRRWPLPGFGALWLEEVQPAASRALWPATNSLLGQVAKDMEKQVREMEKTSKAFFLQAWERGEAEDGAAAPADGGGTYRFAVDTAGFSPEEIAVKLDGRKLTVTAAREKESGRWRERRELRKETLLLPDADLQAVTCSLGPDGRLCVEAPRLTPMETTIPVDTKPDKAQQGDNGVDEPGEKPKA